MTALNPLLILILILDKKMLGTIVLEFFFFLKQQERQLECYTTFYASTVLIGKGPGISSESQYHYMSQAHSFFI